MVGLKLSTFIYEEVARQVHTIAHRVCEGRLVVVSGGGYEPEAVARCWGILLANLAGQVESLGHTYTRLHDLPADLPASQPAITEQVHNLLQALKLMI
jgi:acetoin utilization deacetylase AcuC-like enzyme